MVSETPRISKSTNWLSKKVSYRWALSSGARSGTSLRTEFGNGLFGKVSTFLGFFEFLLCLTEFGQVEGGNFFGFFDLPLVGLDLLLEFVDQVLHTFVVLPVFFGLEAQFLDATFGFPEVLLGVGVSPLFTVEFVFEFSYSLFELGNGLLASLEGVGFGFVKTYLQVLDLSFEGLAEFFLGLSVVLFGAELVSEASSVDHSLLGFFFGVLGFVQELVKIGMQCLEFSLQFPLGSGHGSVLGSEVVELFVGISQFLFGLATSTVGLFQESAGFFELVLEGVGATFRDTQLFAGFVTGTLFLFESLLGVLELLLVAFDGLLGLSVSLKKKFN